MINRYDLLKTSVILHRQWAGHVNEILVCRLDDLREWLRIDALATSKFTEAITSIAASSPGSDALEQLQQIKGTVHQKAHLLIRRLQEEGHVDLKEYRDFVRAHTRFLEDVHAYEQSLWLDYANRDELTGLLNRRSMDGLLELEWRKVAAIGSSCLLVMGDIDHFKQINDTHGHQAGDQVLAMVSKIIMAQVRNNDLAFRYGGEEFLLCLPGLTLDAGRPFIEAVRCKIAGTSINVSPAAAEISVTMSFGISELSGRHPVSRSVGLADEALYCAKQNGRNCVECK